MRRSSSTDRRITGRSWPSWSANKRLAVSGRTPLHVAYMAIAAARKQIVLQNPYFLPDRQALQLFAQAVQRGVDIAIMLPTADTSDFSVVQHASHYYYRPLLEVGVRVYEHTRSGLHQKVMIVDGLWCSIGSTNFDPRSFRINEEITMAALDERIASELLTAYEDDLQHATLWTSADGRRDQFVTRSSTVHRRCYTGSCDRVQSPDPFRTDKVN